MTNGTTILLDVIRLISSSVAGIVAFKTSEILRSSASLGASDYSYLELAHIVTSTISVRAPLLAYAK